MAELVGTIESKSGRQYTVKWENLEVWVREKGTFEWFCVAQKIHKADALRAAQEVIDDQSPAF